MKRPSRVAWLICLLALSAKAAASTVDDMAGACDGAVLASSTASDLRLADTFAAGQCLGAFSAVQEAIGLPARSGASAFGVCLPPKAGLPEMIAAYQEYVDRYAGKLRSDDFFLAAIDALRKAYPCKANKPAPASAARAAIEPIAGLDCPAVAAGPDDRASNAAQNGSINFNQLVTAIDSRSLQEDVRLLASNEAARSYLVRFTVWPLGGPSATAPCGAGEVTYVAWLKLGKKNELVAHKEAMQSSCENTGQVIVKLVGRSRFAVGMAHDDATPREHYLFSFDEESGRMQDLEGGTPAAP